jgi:hypothetical protein
MSAPFSSEEFLNEVERLSGLHEGPAHVLEVLQRNAALSLRIERAAAKNGNATSASLLAARLYVNAEKVAVLMTSKEKKLVKQGPSVFSSKS